MSGSPINEAFNARAHWERVYRRAWHAGRLSGLAGLPPAPVAPSVALDGERALTRVRFMRHRLRLRRDDTGDYRRWVNRDGLALYVLQELDATRNDLDDANPLFWGHVAYVEEGNPVLVVAAFTGTRHLGDLVLQPDANLRCFVALHDLRVFARGLGHGEAVLAALLASGAQPLKVVQAQAAAAGFWSKMGGNEFFDHYGNVGLSWEAYAHRRLGMPVGARAHWEASHARDDAEIWADPARRARLLRVWPGIMPGRQPPPPATD